MANRALATYLSEDISCRLHLVMASRQLLDHYLSFYLLFVHWVLIKASKTWATSLTTGFYLHIRGFLVFLAKVNPALAVLVEVKILKVLINFLLIELVMVFSVALYLILLLISKLI